MIRKTVLIILVFMSILSCSKSKTNTNELKSFSEFTEEDMNFFLRMFRGEQEIYERALLRGPWKVRLANGNIIGKVKSVDKEYSEDAMDKAYLGIHSEDDYDLIIINVKNNTYKSIITDKHFNIKLLPVINNKTTENIDDKYNITFQDKIYTPFFRCFILQTIEHNNTYKLIYLSNIDASIDNIFQKDYEYESTFIPYSAEVTITPNYFIVYHNGNYTVREVDNCSIGEEYILINKKTGEYKVIDSARAIDSDWDW